MRFGNYIDQRHISVEHARLRDALHALELEFPFRVVNPNEPAWMQGTYVASHSEIIDWCRWNLRYGFRVWSSHARFADKKEAALFRIFWG